MSNSMTEGAASSSPRVQRRRHRTGVMSASQSVSHTPNNVLRSPSLLFSNVNISLFHLGAIRSCICSGISISPPVMFVVTALHTKRRPRISVDKSDTTIKKHCVEGLSAVSYSHRHFHPVKLASLSSNRAAHCASEPDVTRSNSDRDAWKRNEKDKHMPIKLPSRQSAPSRARKFIPKPLILVERMRARQFLLGSSPPVISNSYAVPELLNHSTVMMTAPFTSHVASTVMRTCRVPLSGSHSSGSASFRVSARKDVVFGTGFEVIPRPLRPLSLVTLVDSSSSTDTFVADSPCYIKQATSKLPVLAITNIQLDVKSGPNKQGAHGYSAPLLVDSIASDLVHRTCQSISTFEPAMTSTPLAPSRADTNQVLSPTTFITSTVLPPRSSEQKLEYLDTVIGIVSPTSQEAYPFSDPEGAYVVKLPHSGFTTSPSNRRGLASSSQTVVSYLGLTSSSASLVTFANASKPTLQPGRLWSRVPSPSPTLVLDGVFALPCAVSPSSSRLPLRTFDCFPRPHKPTSCRVPADTSNAFGITSPSRPLSMLSASPSRGQSGAESPRSKLAHVLTTHLRPQTVIQMRKRARVPLPVKGIQASNDSRIQCEIEGLRVRQAVGFACGGGDVGGDGGERGAGERVPIVNVGMVAKLRARWETGEVEYLGGAEGRV